jgi:hypothetical protein
MVERTKVLDSLYIKYGMKINYLMAMGERHGLNADQDIKTLLDSFNLKMEQRQQAINKQLELSDEEKAIVDNNIKDVGDIQLDTRGLIPIMTYIKIHISFLRNGYDLRNWGEKEHVEKRRVLMTAGDIKAYETEVQDRLSNLRVKTNGMQKYAFA